MVGGAGFGVRLAIYYQGVITIVICPLCDSVTEKQEFDFWKCPNCGCEVWPVDEEEAEAEKTKAIREVYLEDVKIPLKKKSSGGRSGKRYGKKKVKPIPWYQRYI